MRPSIELPRVSGADSKLDITTVRRSLLRLRRVICHALVSEQTCASFRDFWRPVTLTFGTTFWTKNWHSAYSCRGKRCKLIFFYAFLFFFRVKTPYKTDIGQMDKQTDRQTSKATNAATWQEKIGMENKNDVPETDLPSDFTSNKFKVNGGRHLKS